MPKLRQRSISLLIADNQLYKIFYLIFSVNYVIKNWKPVNTATNNDI